MQKVRITDFDFFENDLSPRIPESYLFVLSRIYKIFLSLHDNMKKQYLIIMSVWLLLIIIIIIFLFFEFQSNPSYANICTALCTYGLVITAIYGFYSNKEAIRMQTSTDFCMKIYNILQSEEYVKRECLIWERLESQEHEVCSIDEIKDEELRRAVEKYCEVLNGIGVFIVEHMIMQ